MATPGRTEDPDLARWPIARTARTASRTCSSSSRPSGCWRASDPRPPVVGRFSNPSAEVVRFAAHAHAVVSRPARFSRSSSATDEPPVMRVNFMGLTGPLGVLPRAYTRTGERADSRARHRRCAISSTSSTTG